MKNRTLLCWSSPLAMNCALPPCLVSAINSRSRRKHGRERGGARRRTRFVLALTACLLVSLCGAHIGFAKSSVKVKKLNSRYLLNKEVKGVDGKQIRRNLLGLLPKRDVKLFLDVIQKAEGGKPNLMVGGCRAKSLKQHPGLTLPRKCQFRIWLNGRWRYSTASGNYQITLSNWKQLAPFLGLQDFSEESQALAALELIRRGGGAAGAKTQKGIALKRRIQTGFRHLLQGDVNSALCLATYDWASSTCSPFPGRKINYVRLAQTFRKGKNKSLSYAPTVVRRSKNTKRY